MLCCATSEYVRSVAFDTAGGAGSSDGGGNIAVDMAEEIERPGNRMREECGWRQCLLLKKRLKVLS